MEVVGTDGVVRIDPGRGVAVLGGREVRLRDQELALLDALARQRGRVLSRSDLAQRLGLPPPAARRCDVLVFRLREALGPEVIRTVRGRGWMLVDHAVAVAQE